MGFEDKEKLGGGKPKKVYPTMTLQKAIDMGEYHSDYLSTFPEWHTLTKYVQFQFIKQGIDNRKRNLTLQWAEINNILDFRLKPHLKEALRSIEKQLKTLDKDRETLYVHFSEI